MAHSVFLRDHGTVSYLQVFAAHDRPAKCPALKSENQIRTSDLTRAEDHYQTFELRGLGHQQSPY
jgi:hypothetical protein